MIKINKLICLASMASMVFALNAYVFSRFTVDDAFITWRYGRNLVEFGVWGYNPTPFDLTQAYTNPLYAALSIVPPALGIDMVWFFKLFSILTFASFLWAFLRISQDKTIAFLVVSFLMAIPSSTIHMFSGLETFLYSILLGSTFIALDRRSHFQAGLYLSALVLCRPESWLLVMLFPFAVIATRIADRRTANASSIDKNPVLYGPKDLKHLAIACAAPVGTLLANLIFHKVQFGYFLPNTFYVKSASGSPFNPVDAIALTLCLTPLLAAIFAGRRLVPALAMTYFLPVIYTYASSDLQMNYSLRFPFQIFVPAFLYAAYTVTTARKAYYVSESAEFVSPKKIQLSHLTSAYLCVLALLYAMQTTNATELVFLANSYPRCLSAHAALGRTLNEIRMKSGTDRFLCGDAGMVAFHSRGIALDSLGLGSALVAHEGVTEQVIDAYAPEFMFLHASPGKDIWADFAKPAVMQWIETRKYSAQCEIYLSPGYSLRLYSKEPNPEIAKLAEESYRVNRFSEKQFFLAHIFQPPWRYWHE